MKETTKKHINATENQPTINNLNKTTTFKRSDTVTQKIEEISHKMQSEHRNTNELQKKFDIQIKKIEVSKERLEADLAKTIAELNKMEGKVFEIQKINLERFKNEIMRYQNIYNELKGKSDEITEQLNQSKTIDNLLYNQTFMLREDYLSYCNELILLKNKVEEKIMQLKQIEQQHPKEFKFMQEEFQLENTLKTITMKTKTNTKLIKKYIKEKESNSKQREVLLKQIVNAEEEMDILLKEVETIKDEDLSIIKLEDSIKKSVNDLVLWDKMKEMMKMLFTTENLENGNSNSDTDKSTQILIIEKSMLKIKMDLMQMKKAKANEKAIIETKVNELNKKIVAKKQQQKHNEELDELENILTNKTNEISAIEGNITIFESVFNKFIVLFKNESKEQNDIENRFKTEMISILISKKEGNRLTHSSESIKSFGLLITDYFDSHIIRDRKSKELLYSQKKVDDRKNILNHDIDKLNEAISSNSKMIANLQQENSQIAKDIITLTETINIKNKNLKSNLEALGEDQFNIYLESNDTVLKNMKKIYGNKILNKVFKVQKYKFLETIIVEHSIKKAIVNESIEFIVQYENIKLHYNTQMEALDSNHQTLLQKYESCLEFQMKKNKEKSILDESSKDLKEKMEIILEEQLRNIQIEKQNLQLQYNVTFYIEQVKEITEQIERLTDAKRSILEEFEAFQKESIGKGYKLFFENADLKQSVATLNGVIPIKDSLYALNNYNNSKTNEERKNSNLIHNIEESVKKSLRDFHNNIETTRITFTKNDNDIIDCLQRDNLISNSRAMHTQGNYRQYTQSTTLDLFTEKLKPLLSGLSLYKKFDSKSMSSRTIAFDPFKADKYPPENCGYALRYFKLLSESKVIAIKKQSSSYHCETKLPLTSLVGIFLGQSSKEILKVQEDNSSNPNHQIELLCKSYFIPFTLVLDNIKIELIAPDYLTYTSFEGAIKDIILNKNHIEGLMEEMN